MGDCAPYVRVMNRLDRQNTDRYIPIITAMLRDVQKRHVLVYTPRSMELDLTMIKCAVELNGMKVLTKDLPALGKALDRALAEQTHMSEPSSVFKDALKAHLTDSQLDVITDAEGLCIGGPGSQLPLLFRDLFSRVFAPEGTVLPNSDVDCVKSIRQLCFTFYKLELPYSPEEEQKVVDQFVKTEREVSSYNKLFSAVADSLDYNAEEMPLTDAPDPIRQIGEAYLAVQPREYRDVIRDARRLLMRLFQHFDPKAIVPKHGPGAVSTKEKLWGKFTFERINPRIDEEYPFCEYFLASGGALVDGLHTIYGFSKTINASCDEPSDAEGRPVTLTASCTPEVAMNMDCFSGVSVPVEHPKGCLSYSYVRAVGEYPAKVILVPKDSRGPRLISCEPLENQWIQQGLGQAIVREVERNPLTRYNVHFTDQEPNRRGALVGSMHGKYATLDLKEASDRVTVGLVRLLFPQPLLKCLLAVRTTGTVLPNEQLLNLEKFAPMGSALCFPIMALSIWALLTARFRGDAHARESLLVYGDDVIVPGYQAQNAICTLEAFGLAINHDKSCTKGGFRESCGMDAFKGIDVTPVRIRTPWTVRTSPKVYLSYIAYANAFRRSGFINVSDKITEWLCRTYGELPSKDMMLNVPSLDEVPEAHRPRKSRYNSRLQKREWYVYSPKAQNIKRVIPGWSMLLRYFSETSSPVDQSSLWLSDVLNDKPRRSGMEDLNCVDYMIEPFSVRLYTPRDAVVLAKSWR